MCLAFLFICCYCCCCCSFRCRCASFPVEWIKQKEANEKKFISSLSYNRSRLCVCRVDERLLFSRNSSFWGVYMADTCNCCYLYVESLCSWTEQKKCAMILSHDSRCVAFWKMYECVIVVRLSFILITSQSIVLLWMLLLLRCSLRFRRERLFVSCARRCTIIWLNLEICTDIPFFMKFWL